MKSKLIMNHFGSKHHHENVGNIILVGNLCSSVHVSVEFVKQFSESFFVKFNINVMLVSHYEPRILVVGSISYRMQKVAGGIPLAIPAFILR